jgi:hypothetical protein
MKPASPSLWTFSRTFSTGWGLANVVGMIVFLKWSASCCWIEPELKDVPGASGGEAFVWALGPLPILAVFVLSDLVWGMVAEVKAPPDRRLRVLAAPLLMLVGWVAVFVFDGLHHGS